MTLCVLSQDWSDIIVIMTVLRALPKSCEWKDHQTFSNACEAMGYELKLKPFSPKLKKYILSTF